MNTVLWAAGAMASYAAMGLLLEQKLSSYNNLSLIVIYSAIIVMLAAIVRAILKDNSVVWNFPTGQALIWVVVLGVVYFIADYCYVASFTRRGDLFTIMSVMTLIPVAASLMKFFYTGILPNKFQILGYVLAAAAVLITTKGSSV